jgi:hypothetical protein
MTDAARQVGISEGAASVGVGDALASPLADACATLHEPQCLQGGGVDPEGGRLNSQPRRNSARPCPPAPGAGLARGQCRPLRAECLLDSQNRSTPALASLRSLEVGDRRRAAHCPDQEASRAAALRPSSPVMHQGGQGVGADQLEGPDDDTRYLICISRGTTLLVDKFGADDSSAVRVIVEREVRRRDSYWIIEQETGARLTLGDLA